MSAPLSTEKKAALTLPMRVKLLVTPMQARHSWIVAFIVLGALNVGKDALTLNPVSIGLALVVGYSLWSLWQSLKGFRDASLTGSMKDLRRGNEDLLRYIKITTIVGFVSLSVVLLVLLLILFVLFSGVIPHDQLMHLARSLHHG